MKARHLAAFSRCFKPRTQSRRLEHVRGLLLHAHPRRSIRILARARLYELPTLSVGYSPFRWWIDGGMCVGTVEEEARKRTITVYTNKRNFKNQLGIPNEETIYIFLVRKDGSVLAMVQGGYTNEKYAQLQKTISTNAQQREE